MSGIAEFVPRVKLSLHILFRSAESGGNPCAVHPRFPGIRDVQPFRKRDKEYVPGGISAGHALTVEPVLYYAHA